MLTPDEADHLFRILGTLRDQGKTVILITHKLREIMAITDRRLGHAPRRDGGDASRPRRPAVERTGRADGRPPRAAARREGPGQARRDVVLEVENLTVRRTSKGVARVDNVSFSVRAGEIVGIAGVSGNGQSELLEVIAGIAKPTSGQVIFEGKDIGMLGDPRHVRAAKASPMCRRTASTGASIASFDASESAILG